MKMVGSVSEVKRLVAKRDKDGTFDEKRQFQINARPATALSSAYSGYGGFNFILHGRELEDFGCDLGDDVEIYVVRAGHDDVPNRDFEDVSRLLYLAEGKITTLQDRNETLSQQLKSAQQATYAASDKGKALQSENVRLTVQVETLMRTLADRDPSTIDMKRIS